MTIEPSYRIDYEEGWEHAVNERLEVVVASDRTPVGVLVPDTRLQAIADAWGDASDTMSGQLYSDLAYESPKLVTLLDELVERGNP